MKEGEREGVANKRSAEMDLNDLLGLGLGLEGESSEVPDFGPLVSSEGAVGGAEQEGGGGEVKSSDVLTDQWNNFSSFMTTTRTPTETTFSEWEKEFTAQSPAPSSTSGPAKEDPFLELDPLATAKKKDKATATATTKTAGATTVEPSGLADDLRSLDLTSAPTALPLQPALIPAPTPLAALPPAVSGPPVLPFSSGRGRMGGAMPNKPHPPGSSKGTSGGKDTSDKKGSSWMNVFAHLDPLSSEKV